ncbi:hypothetical protein TrST_g2238 [Triparma strigata]|uniref:Uncharacterized protein n=1 Tax=Triparma strigata TaxID=1606541 RepID=A0A9W7AGC7_9STRA|nr:hypothetical protein TrST_g2238 [Triparma strigata]
MSHKVYIVVVAPPSTVSAVSTERKTCRSSIKSKSDQKLQTSKSSEKAFDAASKPPSPPPSTYSKFVFPADVMPPHIPPLLNDYMDLVSNDEGDHRDGPSTALVDLGVTAFMCASWVTYARDEKNGFWKFVDDKEKVPGTAEEGAMDFLRLTGAPSDVWFAFRTGQMKACMEREILEVVNSFGAVNYTHHSDTIFYFRKWGLDEGEAVEPVLISDGVYAYLHDDNKEIEALAVRITQIVMDKYSVQQRIMVKEILSRVAMPFYAVPVSEWGNLEVN